MTNPPTARNESDRVLAVVLKALLAGPQFHVWERAAAVICAENTPDADNETAQAVVQSVRSALAALSRHSPGASPEETGYDLEDEDERTRLAETGSTRPSIPKSRPEAKWMKPFEHYRRETEKTIKGMFHDGRLAPNPLADPQRHGESEYGYEGQEYRAKVLRALVLVQSADTDLYQWQEAAKPLHQCAIHAINTLQTAATETAKSVCLASEGAAAAAGIAARHAAAWLE